MEPLAQKVLLHQIYAYHGTFSLDIFPCGSIMGSHIASPKSSSTFGKCCTLPEA